MGIETEIAWTDSTWSPWWGCAKVDAMCTHCYADDLSTRYGHDVWGRDAARKLASDHYWGEPEKWDRRAAAKTTATGIRHRVFCASMCDVFEDRRDLDAPRARLWDLIERTYNLDWLLLTKRPDGMTRLTPDRWRGGWPANVWAGTSVGIESALPRAEALRRVPAAVRFLSVEPLLESLDLRAALAGEGAPTWIIVGGESGAKARPMHPDWARAIRDQSLTAGAAFFFKQWGEWAPRSMFPSSPRAIHRFADSTEMVRVGKRTAGHALDGATWYEWPNERRSSGRAASPPTALHQLPLFVG